MTALILPKLGNCRSSREAIAALENMGARRLGSGHFAVVYAVEVMEDRFSIAPLSYFDIQHMRVNPYDPVPARMIQCERRTVAIKVTKRRDRAALLVARAAMATAAIDPLAPKYEGITEFSDGTWMAELEVLAPLDDHTRHTKHGVTGDADRCTPLDAAVEGSPFLSLLRQHMNRDCQYGWDIHGANVMMRGHQIVVTDPIYYGQDC